MPRYFFLRAGARDEATDREPRCPLHPQRPSAELVARPRRADGTGRRGGGPVDVDMQGDGLRRRDLQRFGYGLTVVVGAVEDGGRRGGGVRVHETDGEERRQRDGDTAGSS